MKIELRPADIVFPESFEYFAVTFGMTKAYMGFKNYYPLFSDAQLSNTKAGICFKIDEEQGLIINGIWTMPDD